MKNNNIKLVINNEMVYASSREIAKDFGKEHAKVIRSIENITKNDSSQNWLQYFIYSNYKDSSGKSNKEYLITKDGFSLLAMGFTGAKALKFKIEYINKFNEMETQLKEINTVMDTKGKMSEEEYAEIKFSTAQRVKNAFMDSVDIFVDYDRFIAYSRKTMDVTKRVRRLNQIIDALNNKEDNLYIKKSRGYKADRENIIELKEIILRDINEINNRSYGQKLGYATRKMVVNGTL